MLRQAQHDPLFQQIHLDAAGGDQDNIIDALYFVAYLSLGKKKDSRR